MMVSFRAAEKWLLEAKPVKVSDRPSRLLRESGISAFLNGAASQHPGRRGGAHPVDAAA